MANGEGLRNQIIGNTYINVYHLMLPYVIGDARMTYIPVYIQNNLLTCLSFSKQTIKIGNYIYPNVASAYNPFFVDYNKMQQYSKFEIRDDRIVIGENVFDISSLSSLEASENRYIFVTDENGNITPVEAFKNTGKVFNFEQSITPSTYTFEDNVSNIICAINNNGTYASYTYMYGNKTVTNYFTAPQNYINISVNASYTSIELYNLKIIAEILNDGGANG